MDMFKSAPHVKRLLLKGASLRTRRIHDMQPKVSLHLTAATGCAMQ